MSGNKTEEQEFTEVAKMLNMSLSHVREMINISRDMVSLDAEVGNSDHDRTTLGDFVEDTATPQPDEKILAEAMSNDIAAVLDTLKPNEAKVLRLRFGLNGAKPMSLKEVGDICNLTKERIRQIEKHAITRMQHPTRLRRLEAYVA